ncbi:MAG TPA: protein YgfX [Rugosibacter sp.]
MRPVAKYSVFVRPSRFLKRLVWIAHFITACIVLSTNVPDLLQGALLLLIGASWIKNDGMASTTELILHGDGRIKKVGVAEATPLQGGRTQDAHFSIADGDTANDMVLHPHSTVLPFLVILLYRQKSRLQSLVLLKDSLEAEDFRQLRLWLRWQIKQMPPK